MGKLRDLTGQRFGRLLVLERHGSTRTKQATWLCQCDCGATSVAISLNLGNGNTQSCGCLKRDVAKKQFTTHGMSKTRIHSVWATMIQRCVNPKDKGYFRYGGRGISVCDEWLDFAAFYRDMGECPPGFSLERKKNNLGYSKENCVWATWREQNNNRRNSRLFFVNGRKINLTQISEQYGISRSGLNRRLGNGWSIERAISTPINTAFRSKNHRV